LSSRHHHTKCVMTYKVLLRSRTSSQISKWFQQKKTIPITIGMMTLVDFGILVKFILKNRKNTGDRLNRTKAISY